jgi:hypothetical protein
VAEWTDDLADKQHVWDLYRRTSPRGAGYDLGGFWRSPSDPQLHVLRLTPWRIQVIRGTDLRSRIWQPELSTRRDPVAAGSAVPT